MYPETAPFSYHVAYPVMCPAKRQEKTNMLVIILIRDLPSYMPQICPVSIPCGMPCFCTMWHAMCSYHMACPYETLLSNRKKLISFY